MGIFDAVRKKEPSPAGLTAPAGSFFEWAFR
jgi:hypothetical protein